MGSDLIQSILIAELMTQTIKYSVRRERPDNSNAYSFPSGHAADTMAFATALERHFNWKYYLPAYAFATYVAMSRLHDNVHFVSDVAFGSAVGIIAGRTVTRYGHRPFPVAMTAVPGGFAIVYLRQGDQQN
jgi:membrane-associated phospholipid phosphatase